MIGFDLAYGTKVIVLGPPGSGRKFEVAHAEAIRQDLLAADPDELAAVVEQCRKDMIEAIERMRNE